MGFFSRLFGRATDAAPTHGQMLTSAALSGDVDLAREALEDGANPNIGSSESGPPPIVLSAVKGHGEVVEVLLAGGADVNKTDPQTGMTALHAAALHGNEPLVKSLLQRGAKLEIAIGAMPLTPLAHAIRKRHQGVIKLLLKAGANPNIGISLPTESEDSQGATPMIQAASDGDVALVRLLAKHKADPNAYKADGMTPLLAAVFRGHLEVIQALVDAGANVNLIHAGDPSRPIAPVDLAKKLGHEKIAEFLKQRGAMSVPWA